MQIDPLVLKILEIGAFILIGIAGFAVALIVNWFKSDVSKLAKALDATVNKFQEALNVESEKLADMVKAETKARESADLELAKLLAKATEALQGHQLNCERRMSGTVDRDSLDKRMILYDNKVDKLHARLDGIGKSIATIEANMVTKKECLNKRDCPE